MLKPLRSVDNRTPPVPNDTDFLTKVDTGLILKCNGLATPKRTEQPGTRGILGNVSHNFQG